MPKATRYNSNFFCSRIPKNLNSRIHSAVYSNTRSSIHMANCISMGRISLCVGPNVSALMLGVMSLSCFVRGSVGGSLIRGVSLGCEVKARPMSLAAVVLHLGNTAGRVNLNRFTQSNLKVITGINARQRPNVIYLDVRRSPSLSVSPFAPAKEPRDSRAIILLNSYPGVSPGCIPAHH